MATDAPVDPPQIMCECGRDHRGPDSRSCLVFNILNRLNNEIREFLRLQEVLEFGKDGALAHGLRSVTLEQYDETMDAFKRSEDDAEKHPEWHLAEKISTLRRYFQQVADGCDEAKKTLGPRPPPSVVPNIVGNEDESLRDAKKATIECYEDCFKYVIKEWMLLGADPVSVVPDPEGWLQQVDEAFREAFEKIVLLPKTENAKVQDLTNKSYRIWKESRRLLCDFRRFAS